MTGNPLRWRAVLVVLAVLVAGCASSGLLTDSPGESSAGDARTYEVTVERVVDGDTLAVAYRNGTRDTVRLVGVDTPEVHVAVEPAEFEGVRDTGAGRECLREWGHRASEFARTELLGETVTLALDPEEGPRDRYGRLLAYVVVGDERPFNYRLVAQGYARVYDSGFTRQDAFYAAEADAQAARLGLWTCRNPDATATTADDAATATTEATTTRTADGGTALAVLRVHADAAGNDHENPNGEYVVFENAGSEPLDLSGWTVRDDDGHAYRFPSGFTLDAGATVTLYTGNGTDTASALYWGSASAIWNNGGDTVVVATANGAVVVRSSYS